MTDWLEGICGIGLWRWVCGIADFGSRKQGNTCTNFAWLMIKEICRPDFSSGPQIAAIGIPLGLCDKRCKPWGINNLLLFLMVLMSSLKGSVLLLFCQEKSRSHSAAMSRGKTVKRDCWMSFDKLRMTIGQTITDLKDLSAKVEMTELR